MVRDRRRQCTGRGRGQRGPNHQGRAAENEGSQQIDIRHAVRLEFIAQARLPHLDRLASTRRFRRVVV